MAIHKYEIEYKKFEGWVFESEIAMLTGLDLMDIIPVSGNIQTYYGRTYRHVLQTLGYSCNKKFIKFDKNTEYPCLIRTKIPHDKNHWAAFVYYDGHVYDYYHGILTWAQWNHVYPNFRITSMLQVWI